MQPDTHLDHVCWGKVAAADKDRADNTLQQMSACTQSAHAFPSIKPFLSQTDSDWVRNAQGTKVCRFKLIVYVWVQDSRLLYFYSIRIGQLSIILAIEEPLILDK